MLVLIAVAISIHPGVVCSHFTSLVSLFQSHVSGWDLPYQASQEAIANSHLPTEKKKETSHPNILLENNDTREF